MPRYRYQCHSCHAIQVIFHLMSEKLTQCPLCNTQNKMTKLLTTPHIVATQGDLPAPEIGEITKEHIEANREILKQQKEEAKKETYEPS